MRDLPAEPGPARGGLFPGWARWLWAEGCEGLATCCYTCPLAWVWALVGLGEGLAGWPATGGGARPGWGWSSACC